MKKSTDYIFQFHHGNDRYTALVFDDGKNNVWQFRGEMEYALNCMRLKHETHWTVDIQGSTSRSWRIVFKDRETYVKAKMIYG